MNEFDGGPQLFLEQLPLSGAISRHYPECDWYLLDLDSGFDYQKQKDGRFAGFRVDQILIRSRWVGVPIGGSKPTSVFVLLSDDPKKFDSDTIRADDFYFESWAMCQNEIKSEPSGSANAATRRG